MDIPIRTMSHANFLGSICNCKSKEKTLKCKAKTFQFFATAEEIISYENCTITNSPLILLRVKDQSILYQMIHHVKVHTQNLEYLFKK